MRWSWALWVAMGCSGGGKDPVDTDREPTDTGTPSGPTTDTGTGPTTPTTDTGCDTPTTWFEDADGDGVGLSSRAVEACVQPAGTAAASGDCDDANRDVHPGATEVCNGVDDDCANGEVGAVDEVTWYLDADRDGAGDPATGVVACEGPRGAILTGGDCDDVDASVHPGAVDTCDGVDDDCSGDESNAVDTTAFYADVDQDGFGDDAARADACTAPPGHTAAGGDCDDGNPAVNPGATDVCNGIDDDCSGDESNAVDPRSWGADADGDGFGDPSTTTSACRRPAGTVADVTDCDDTDAAVHPGAVELCNGADDNCSGDETDALDPSSWWPDLDGDGFGDPFGALLACVAPPGTVADAQDCDDGDAAVNPDATDVCNGTDDDCTGDETNAVDATPWHADGDRDGYGDASVTVVRCTAPPARWPTAPTATTPRPRSTRAPPTRATGSTTTARATSRTRSTRATGSPTPTRTGSARAAPSPTRARVRPGRATRPTTAPTPTRRCSPERPSSATATRTGVTRPRARPAP